jgi:putative MFS transporter
MAEVWPAGLRASGMGLGCGVGNLGKIISPLGLALIFGGTNIIRPEASLNAMIPAMFFLAFWAALAAAAFVALGIETKGPLDRGHRRRARQAASLLERAPAA